MFRICFTGHRGNNVNMGGFNWFSTKNLKITKILFKEILKQIETHKDEDIEFINGMALLTDQIVCSITQKLKNKFKNIYVTCAIPYKEFPNHFFKKDQIKYYDLLNKVDKIVYVDTIDEYKVCNLDVNKFNVIKLQKRNEYMVDNSDIVIAIWDEDRSKKSGTKNCINYAKRKGKKIIIINPKYI